MSHGLSIQSWKRRLGTFPLNRQRWNSPLVFFGSNNRYVFPSSRQLALQSSHLSSARKFPIVQSWASPVTRKQDPSDMPEPWNALIADNSEIMFLSEPLTPPTSDKLVPWDIHLKDTMKHQYQTGTNSVNSWVSPLASIIGLHTLPLVNSGISCFMFSSGIQKSQLASEISTVKSQVQSSMLPFQGQPPVRPWLKITPDIGPWTHSVMQIQSSEESFGSQIQHVAGRVNSVVKPVTYNWHPWVPLTINKIEFWTCSTLNADGSQYPKVTVTLEPLFQPVLKLYGSQKLPENTSEHWILPRSKLTELWTSSAINMPFTWVPSTSYTIRSWVQYKTSLNKASRQIDRINPLSKHESIMVKSQVQTADTTWLLKHTIIDVIESFIQSKAHIIRSWIQPEGDTIQSWSQSETQARIPHTQLKVDTVRQRLQTKTERIWIQPEFQIVKRRVQSEHGRDKNWTLPEANAIRSVTHIEIKTVRVRKQPNAATARSWLWTRANQMRPRFQPDFKTHYPWIRPEVDTVRSWNPSEAGNIQPGMNPEASIFRIWTQSKVNMVIPWTGPEADAAKLWLLIKTNKRKTWSQPESQIFWSQPKADKIRSWLHTEMDTFTPWIGTEFQTAHSWAQPEGDIARLWTKSKDNNIRHWFQTQMETATI